MADAQITLSALGEYRPVVLVTDDDALARLVALETGEMGVPLVCITAVERELEEGRIAILDLDSRGGMQAALHGLVDRFVGICHQTASLPTLLATRAVYLLERPFATAEFRALLGQLRTGSLPVMTSATVNRDASHALPITLENDTVLRCGDATVHLTPREAALMRCLLDMRGQTVPRDRLRECLEPNGRSEGGNEVEVYLCYLRRKLEKPTLRRLITTVRGVGYRLEWGEK